MKFRLFHLVALTIYVCWWSNLYRINSNAGIVALITLLPTVLMLSISKNFRLWYLDSLGAWRQLGVMLLMGVATVLAYALAYAPTMKLTDKSIALQKLHFSVFGPAEWLIYSTPLHSLMKWYHGFYWP